MKPTGKAEQDFENWLEDTDNIYGLDLLSNNEELNIITNALIIEWFDSVGIYICIEPFKEFSKDVYFDVHLDFELYGVWSSRQEATEKGIIKANEIYNNIK